MIAGYWKVENKADRACAAVYPKPGLEASTYITEPKSEQATKEIRTPQTSITFRLLAPDRSTRGRELSVLFDCRKGIGAQRRGGALMV